MGTQVWERGDMAQLSCYTLGMARVQILICVVFYTMVSLCAVNGGQANVLLRESLGVVFEKLNYHVKPAVGDKKLTFVLNTPHIDERLLKAIKNSICNQKAQECQIRACKLPMTQPVCYEILDEINHSILLSNELSEKILAKTAEMHDLLEILTFRDTQAKRALLNLGSFLSSLIGVASMDDINNLYQHIKILKTNVQSAVADRRTLFENIASLANTTDVQFNSLWHALDATDQNSVLALQRVGRVNQKLNDFMKEFLNISGGYRMLITFMAHNQALLHRVSIQ